MWKSKDELPDKQGYYMTFYLNTDSWKKKVGEEYVLTSEPRELFKAFYWNGDKWVFRFDPDVICWWAVEPHPYYVPCQMQGGIAPLTDEMLEAFKKE